MTLRGTTSDFALDVVLRLLAETKKTGELTVRGTGGEGALGIAEGRVVTAVFADEKPIPALGAIFQITDAAFEFTPWRDAPTANLEGDLPDNLRKVEEYKQWLASVREVIPNDRVRFRLSERAAEQGAITFTSERWRVVLAVNGQRDVNDLAAHLHLDRDAALTTLASLVRDGVIETVDAPPAPPTEASPASEPAPAPASKDSEWTAALLSKAEPSAAPEPPPVEVMPPPAVVAPPPAALTPPLAAPAQPSAPTPELVAHDEQVAPWQPMAPLEPSTPPEPAAAASTGWGPPAPEPAAAPAPQEPAPQDWGASAAPPVEPPATPPPLDDRLAALFGSTGIPPEPATPPPATPTPAAEQWTPPPDQWTAPAAELDPLDPWSAPAMPAGPPVAQTHGAAPSEWAPPPELGAAQPKKKGMFGLFRKDEAATSAATAELESGASSRAGLLAAFSNALLSEYNSGQYGKAHVEDRIPSLLMRVDEQADPIDKPLPIVDDRLDVQALERVALPDTQSVPYLALLVSTIYSDAEKAFGRDKAKRGYRAAQQRVFAGDASALGGSDLAGKLPKI